MDLLLQRKIKHIIKSYFDSGKADTLKSAGYNEIKQLLNRDKAKWSEVKNQLNNIVKEVENELYEAFKSERNVELTNALKDQLAGIIKRTENNLSGVGEKAQEVIQKSLEKSVKNGSNWEREAIKGFTEIGLATRHIKTELETTRAAFDNLRRYNNFMEGEAQFFRYAGPQTVRPFCIDKLNRVYNLSEVNKMVNSFGQKTFTYCGGYNCRHRWAPVRGKMEGNLFLEKSWSDNYNQASKNEKKVLDKEYQAAIKLSKHARTELNKSLGNKYGKDTDLLFDGSYAQLKQPVTNRINGLKRLPRKDQADLMIVELKSKPDDFNRVLGGYRKFISDNQGKRIMIFYNNEIEEVII